MTNTISLDENYSTTRLLCKIVNDECLMMNGRIKEECKWNINNSEFNIQNSKLIGSPEDKFETVLFLPEGEERKGEGGLRTKGYFKKSFDDKPLISIITVVYNGEKFLEETMQSVINQSYDNVEYIIIDGGSTDGTLDIIKKYEDRIDYWVSEKDKGIYDAMNKGIDVASGEFINFMNAGDSFFCLNIIKDINLSIYKEFNFLYGDAILISEGNKESKITHPEILNKLYLLRRTINHQSMFISSKILKMYKYDISYEINADYDLLLKLYFKKQLHPKFLNKTITYYDGDGFSSMENKKLLIERYQIHKKYYSKFYQILFQFYSQIRILLK